MDDVSNDVVSTMQDNGGGNAPVQHLVPFTEAVLRYVRGFTIDGRSSRSELWWAVLFAFVLSGGISALCGGTVFDRVCTITLVILNLCIGWRRMHDLGETGLWSLVPLYNLYLAMKPSVLVENQYGPIPNTKPITVKMSHKIVITTIFVLSLSAAIFGGSGDTPKDPLTKDPLTVAQYTQKQIQDWSNEVSSWAAQRPAIVKRVEDRHGTVTVKKVQIKHYSVQTIDGGNFIYDDGANVSEHKLILRFWWDGIIHQDGHTDVGFLIDKDGKCVKTWTDDTDALIDFEDPDFWYVVGASLVEIL